MIMNEALIDLSVEKKTKEEVIRHLAGLALSENRVKDVDTYTQAVLHREAEYSTAVGFGVAIPHGKTNAVIEPFLCFGRVHEVDWNALDGEPVDLVFLIGVPEEEAGSLHLKILASISRKLMKQEFRNGLRNVKNAEELIQFLRDNDVGL